MVARWTRLNILLLVYSSCNYLLCLAVWFLFQANFVINTANNPTIKTASTAVHAIRGISPIHVSAACPVVAVSLKLLASGPAAQCVDSLTVKSDK